MTITRRFSRTAPVSMAQGRHGELIVAQGNGVRPARWSGSGEAVDAGMDAPADAPAVNVTGPPKYYVARVDINKPGACYYGPPEVSFVLDGTSTRGAKAAAYLNQASLGEIRVLDGGKGYTEQPSVELSDSHGKGAEIEAVLDGPGESDAGDDPCNNRKSGISTWTVVENGGNDATFAGLGPTNGGWSGEVDLPINGNGTFTHTYAFYIATATVGPGRLARCDNPPASRGFTRTLTYKVSGMTSGSCATLRLKWFGGTFISQCASWTGAVTLFVGGATSVQSATPYRRGKDFSDADTVRVTILPILGDAGKPIVIEGITRGNENNTEAPRYKVKELIVKNGGSGYLVAPQIKITSNSGFGAYATCKVKNGSITEVTLENSGGGYRTAPTVEVVAGGAEAFAVSRPHLRGTYQCYYRYVDGTPDDKGGPIPSNLSPVKEIDAGDGAAAAAWIVAGPSGRAERVELWRSTGDQATTLYRVAVLDAGEPGEADTESALQFERLEGSTAGLTGVFRADLSAVFRKITSITIRDSGTGVGGAAGKFSGFDLDAIRLSTSLATKASEVNALEGLGVFDFTVAGTALQAGTQRPTTNPLETGPLLGTAGGQVDNSQATLGVFDAGGLVTQDARGSLALGDGGEVTFTLTSPVIVNGPLYLYIGEAGNNGETVSGSVEIGGVLAEGEVAYTDDLTDDELRDADRADYAAMPIVLPNGEVNANRFGIPPSDKSAVVRFQDRFWYGVDTGGDEPNTIYYSEVDEPESVPDTNEIILQQNAKDSDRLRAMIPFGSALLLMQERHAFSLTFAKNPILDAQVTPLAYRGCLNQRSWDIYGGVCYVLDQYGVYAITPTGQVESLSDAIDTLFRTEIDFGKSVWSFVLVDAKTKTLRAFLPFKEDNPSGYPTRALCYSLDTKAWWVEKHPQRLSGGTQVRLSNGDFRCVYAGQSGPLLLDEGFADLGRGSVVSVSLVNAGVGYRTPPKVTAPGGSGAIFQASINKDGNLTAIWTISPGHGYRSGALFIEQPNDPNCPAPVQAEAAFTATDSTSDMPLYPTYRFKGGSAAYATEADDPKAASSNPRDITLHYAPLPKSCEVGLRTYYNNSPAPRYNVAPRNRGVGFRNDTIDNAVRHDMGSAVEFSGSGTGIATAMFSGKTLADTQSGDAYVAVELVGPRKSADPVTFYGMELSGTKKGG